MERPDKFTPENIVATFQYIDNYFAGYDQPNYDFPSLSQNFTW